MQKKGLMIIILLIVAIVCKNYLGESVKVSAEETANVIGNGYLKSEKYEPTSNYHSLEVENKNVNIVIKNSPALPYVNIIAESNLVDYIKPELRDGTLSISVEKNVQPTTDITCEIDVNSLVGISVKGDGDVRIEGILTGVQDKHDLERSMSITHSGSGRVELTIDVDGVKFNAADSCGNVVIKGQSRKWFAIFHSNKAGKIDLSRLDSPDIYVSGNGLVTVNPQKLLHMSIKEPGGVLYIKNRSKPLLIRNIDGLYPNRRYE